MKLPKFLTTIAAAVLLATCAGVTESKAIDFFEGVDWKNRVVTVTGESVVPPDAINYTQAKGLASRGAQADAYRKLGEMINGVRVEGDTTVEKMLTTKDSVKLRVEATIKGAKVIDETFLSDGGYRIKMQVPLFGVTNSLASAVFEKNYSVEPFPDPEFAFSDEENYIPSQPYQSPLERKSGSPFDLRNKQNLQAGSLTAIYQPPVQNSQIAYETPRPTMPKKSVEDYAAMAQGDYTGLVVDCRGLELQPVMSPVIQNSNGTKIYGHKNLDIDRIIREGMADYVDDVENVDRAGKNPLVVKAVALENFNSNPVVAIPDSNRILIENHATKFLKDLKVVFLFD